MQEQQQGRKVGDVVGGRYRIMSVLGSGGMATVYLAEDLKLSGKRWAVKEIKQNAQLEHEFLVEAEMLARLNHPNLPEIVDYFPGDRYGFSYLVTDYIDGETLLQRFERQGRRMPASQAVDYALQLCDVFHYLHSQRPEPIIYRDVKPANLMIDTQERIRLIDFGIARSFKIGQAADTVRIGTIGFAAPEQFEGKQTDARTDLFGLGALLYFLLSGGHYYYAARRSLREHSASLPESLLALVEKLLQAVPDARCQSAAEVRGELQRALAKPELAGSGVAGRAVSASAGVQAGAAAGVKAGAAAGVEQRGAQNGGAQASAIGSASADEGAGLAKPSPRVVAVAGLYAGAGATFAALALARVLHELGVRHAVLEAPALKPELYALLFAEKHAPAGYHCYNEAWVSEQQLIMPPAWEDGCTLWLPLSPYISRNAAGGKPSNRSLTGMASSNAGHVSEYGSEWTMAEAPRSSANLLESAAEYEHSMPLQAFHSLQTGIAKAGGRHPPEVWRQSSDEDDGHKTHFNHCWHELLEEIDRPVILVDVGSEWQNPGTRELIELASELVYVVDPLLHKLESASARSNMRFLNELRASGKPVFGIANKAVASSHTAQWLSVLPEPPVCKLPAIDFAKIAEASWLGVLVQDSASVKAQLERSLGNWLRGWLPYFRAKGMIRKRHNRIHG
jgi:hypothetical protein